MLEKNLIQGPLLTSGNTSRPWGTRMALGRSGVDGESGWVLIEEIMLNSCHRIWIASSGGSSRGMSHCQDKRSIIKIKYFNHLPSRVAIPYQCDHCPSFVASNCPRKNLWHGQQQMYIFKLSVTKIHENQWICKLAVRPPQPFHFLVPLQLYSSFWTPRCHDQDNILGNLLDVTTLFIKYWYCTT